MVVDHHYQAITLVIHQLLHFQRGRKQVRTYNNVVQYDQWERGFLTSCIVGTRPDTSHIIIRAVKVQWRLGVILWY